MLLNRESSVVLLYNWPKIFAVTQGDSNECLRILRMLVNNEIPTNKYDPIYFYSQTSFTGQSFLLNPEVLLFNAYKYSARDLCIYLAIASIRSLAEFQANDITTLPLIHSPVHPHEYLDNIRLLPIDDDDLIHFLYEEVPSNKEIH